MKQTITIKIVNRLTRRIMVESSFVVSNYSYQVMMDNAYSFQSLIPEGKVTVSCSNGESIELPSLIDSDEIQSLLR